MNSRVSKIINKALDGGVLTEKEGIELLSWGDLTDEAAAIRIAGRRLSEHLAPKAEIHGQIGLNIGPCPRDCQFCSFAVSNKVFDQCTELPLETVVDYAQLLEEQGANAIYLMTTAQYDQQKFLDYGKAAAKVLKKGTPLIANVGDFDLDYAKELKKAGFTGVYHVIRMGEGVVTRCDVDKRWNTIHAAQDAGLLLGSCVEPVGPEHSVEEIVEKTIITRDMKAQFSGSMRRTAIPSSPLAKYGTVTYAHMATIVAAVALITGEAIMGNCTHEPNQLAAVAGANLLWAEVGSNPRDVEGKTEENRGWTVRRCRDLLHESGWSVLEGPSVMFGAAKGSKGMPVANATDAVSAARNFLFPALCDR